MALDILELRAYARAKDALDRAQSDKEIPNGPVIDRVFEIQAEIHRRKRGETDGRINRPCNTDLGKN